MIVTVVTFIYYHVQYKYRVTLHGSAKRNPKNQPGTVIIDERTYKIR